MKIAGSGSISQKHGSADPDPDPPQNVMDPEHWLTHTHTHTTNCWVSFILYCRESDKYPVFQFSQKALNRLPFRLAFCLHGGGGGSMSEVGRGLTVPPLTTRLAESTDERKKRGIKGIDILILGSSGKKLITNGE